MAKALGIAIGETVEIGAWRMHRFTTTIVATDLANAGRRGRQVAELRLSYYGKERSLPLESMTMEFIGLANRGASRDRMAQAFSEQASVYGLDFSTLTLRGVDVERAGTTLRITTDALTIEATSRRFHIVDRLDKNNGSMASEPSDGSVRAAVRFMMWAEKNRVRIEAGMRFGAIVQELRQAGIEAHVWCSVD